MDWLNELISKTSTAADNVYEDQKEGEYTKAYIITGVAVGVLALGFYAIYRFSK